MHNFSGSTSYKLSDSIVIDLTKMNCKDYYLLYVNVTKIEPTGLKKWQKDLNLKNFLLEPCLHLDKQNMQRK